MIKPLVTIEPANPFDLQDDELAPLLVELGQQDVRVSVVRRPETGYGVTWWEVINVWVDISEVLGGTVAALDLLRIIVEWTRRRWQRDKDDRPDAVPRPRSVILYGPDGRAIKSVLIDEPHGEPEEQTIGKAVEPYPRPGPRQ